MSVLVASGADTLSNRFVKVLARAPRLFIISRSHPLASLVACPEENSIKNPQKFSLHHLENQTLVSGVPGQKICEDISQIITKYRLNNLSLVPVQNRKTNIAMAECGLAIAFLPAIYVTKPENHPEKKEEPPGIDKQCAIYKEKYLTCKPLAKRAHVCIEQENVSLIKQLLLVIEPKASISGYINNIVNEHLEKCKPEIIKLYKEKKADYGN